jgi:hypothetical protein
MPMLTPMAGSGGMSNGGSSNGGSSNGGSSNGGSSNGGSANGGTGSGQGGSTNPGNGGSANGGSGGTGMGGMTAVGGSGGGEGEPDAGGPDPVGETVSFAEDLHQQIFVPRCGSCHGVEWGSATLTTAYAAAVANADEIAGRVDGSGGNIMPNFCGNGPGQGSCLSVAQVELIQSWVDDDTPP